MQATIIYNENAGSIAGITVEDLKEALHEVGYAPVYKATSSEQDLDPILADVEGLVVVAGGDGTLRAVATRLIGKNVPISLLPLGTANNIAKTLELQGSPLEIIAGLESPYKRYFDVGYIQAPWGEDYFLEGCGYGFFADALAMYGPENENGKSILKMVDAILQTLDKYESYPSRARLDDQEFFGNYLLVEVLNTVSIGPRLKLAPQANPDDGLLEVVSFHQDDRDGFLNYVTHLLLENLEELPSVEVARGRRLEIAWTGFPFHVDGEIRPGPTPWPRDQIPAQGVRPYLQAPHETTINVELLSKALEFWLPQLEAKT